MLKTKFFIFPIFIPLLFLTSCNFNTDNGISVNYNFQQMSSFSDNNTQYSNILPQVDYTTGQYTGSYDDPKMLADLNNKLTTKNIINGILKQEHDKLIDNMFEYNFSLHINWKDNYLTKFSYKLTYYEVDSSHNILYTRLNFGLKKNYKCNIFDTFHTTSSNDSDRFNVWVGISNNPAIPDEDWPLENLDVEILNNHIINYPGSLESFSFSLSPYDLQKVTYPTN